MNPRVVITFLLCLLAASIVFGSNNWKDFDANDIYGKYDLTGCAFPFTYNGKTYNNCTTDGDNGDRPWCSLTSNYIGKFKYCYDFWQSSLQCVFPFTLNGVTHNKCQTLSRTSPYKQCRSNNDKYRYRFCIEEHLKKNNKLYPGDKCSSDYKGKAQYHTKCFGPSQYAVPIKISSDEQDAILQTHNSYRANIGTEPGEKPGAVTMMKLYWDDDLADMAQAHSDMCAFDHDLSDNRLTLKYNWKNGQNMVMSTELRSSYSDLLTMMFDSEKPRFQYGVGCNPAGSCTHYTQLMLSNMTRVGCAVTHCLFPDRVERYLVCNYIHAQYTNNYMIPYIPSDSPGSGCPNKKDDQNLCDCGNKICKYDQGENLNPNTCACEGGSGKRSFEERSTEEDLENSNDKFAALPHNPKVESVSREERGIKTIPFPHGHDKRNFRKLIVNRREQMNKEFSEGNMED